MRHFIPIAICLLMTAAVFAQAPTQMPMQQGAGQAPQLIAEVTAIRADGAEGAASDVRLQPYQQLLEDLPYSRYELASTSDAPVPIGSEMSFPLPGGYTFHITMAPPQQQNAYPFLSRIVLQQEGEQIEALSAEGLAAPNQALVYQGLPLAEGELVVVLRLASAQDQQQDQQQQDQEQEGEEQQDQEQQDQEQQEQQDQQQPQDQEQEPQESQEQQEQDPEMRNIEAILESLEEQDREEQERAHYNRTDVGIEGEWW